MGPNALQLKDIPVFYKPLLYVEFRRLHPSVAPHVTRMKTACVIETLEKKRVTHVQSPKFREHCHAANSPHAPPEQPFVVLMKNGSNAYQPMVDKSADMQGIFVVVTGINRLVHRLMRPQHRVPQGHCFSRRYLMYLPLLFHPNVSQQRKLQYYGWARNCVVLCCRVAESALL